MSWKRACLGALAVLLSSTGLAQAQQTRIINGTVKEAVTSEVVVGATVIIKGTSTGALTELDGSFTITGAPLGDVVLEVTSPGHKTTDILVARGQNQIGIELELDAVEQIVVTGRAPELFRKNLNNGASTVRGDALNAVPNSTVGAALQGKVAGANIQSNSGAPGGGIQVAMRGVSTIAGRTDILYVVDGVIVSDAAVASGINVVTASSGGSNASNQDNPVNRIADLNPNDIESIEVLKGASAAALYGSKASNGVVIITTKRGRTGKPKVTVTQRFGMAQVARTLGARDWTQQEVVDAFGQQVADDYYVADGDGYVKHDHERQIMHSKLASETAVSLSGGTDTTKYLFSGLVRDEPGIIKGTGYQKQTARMALDQKLGKKLNVSFTTNFIHSNTRRGVTNNDNNSVSHYMVLAFTPNFIDLRPYEDGSYPTNPFVSSLNNPLQMVALMRDAEDVWRNISSLSASYDVWSNKEHSIKLTGIAGLDRFQSRGSLLFPRELHFEPIDDGLAGTAVATTAESQKINWGVNLIHNYTPTSEAFRSVGSFGVYYDENKLNVLRVFSEGLAAGPGTIDTGSSIQTTDGRLLERDLSISVQEEVQLLDERLSLLAAVLADRSSNNGDPSKFFLFPKASAAYRVPVESKDVSLLRVRAAYGETGNKPAYGQRFTNLAVTGTISGNNGIGLTGAAGNPEIEPERQREVEFGVDLSAFDGRLVAEGTFYQRNISDLILPQQLAPSTGFSTQVGNIASLRNRGLELMVQGTPVRTPDMQWLSRAIFFTNRAVITDLDVPAFRTGGFGVSLGAFFIEEGKSATQIVGNSLDPDTGEISQVVVGDATPDFRMSFVNDFTWKNLTFHTLVDWQKGSDVINLTRLLYDFGQNTVDFVGAGETRLNGWLGGDTYHYIEDGSFIKVREISVTYKLPQSLVKQFGPMQEGNITLAGRNLFIFTDYTGVDPEVSNFGRQSIARNIDVAPYPPNRSLWLSLSASF